MTTLTNTEKEVLRVLASEYPLGDVRTAQLISIAEGVGMPHVEARRLQNKMTKIHKGFYNFHNILKTEEGGIVVPLEPVENEKQVEAQEEIFVPKKDPTFVRWGHTKDVETIVSSGQFYPIWIAGLSGNGKTIMVEQICAKLKREMLRVQVSEDTDEDSLIGGFQLVSEGGTTVTKFVEGPVVRAMKAGAVLLIDEMDRPERPLMCLQGVLEGKPILIKKTGEVVKPAPGFTVIATGNTLGRGSDDGKFISARILDEALLERFVLTFDQPYPTAAVEKKILMKHMDKYGKSDEEFADKLVLWAEAIRKTYEDDGIEDIITTRRLCHIVHTFSIFEDRQKSVELCISRFDEQSKAAFLDFYGKIDPNKVDEEEETPVQKTEYASYDEIPF